MPNMSGVECFHELQKIEGFSIPVVIALTADALSDSRDKYIEKGFTDYLSKPFSKDQIEDKLDIIFKNKE